MFSNFTIEIELDDDGMVYASIYDPRFTLLGQGESYNEAFQCLSEQLSIALNDIDNKEYSGKLNVRMPSTMHAQLAKIAQIKGESINDLIVDGISKSLPTLENT